MKTLRSIIAPACMGQKILFKTLTSFILKIIQACPICLKSLVTELPRDFLAMLILTAPHFLSIRRGNLSNFDRGSLDHIVYSLHMIFSFFFEL